VSITFSHPYSRICSRTARHVAEFQSRCTSCLLGRKPALLERRRSLFQVVFYFVGDIVIGPGSIDERTEAAG
jgi:hypothetical protein